MRIGIDARGLHGPATGVGRYLLELAARLPGLIPEAEFILYAPVAPKLPLGFPPMTIRLDDRMPFRNGRLSTVWLRTRAGALCRQDRLDRFWAPMTLLPVLPPSVRAVVSVHDLKHLQPTSAKTLPTNYRLAFRRWFAPSLKRADCILCNTRGTAARVEELLGLRAHGICMSAVAPEFRPRTQPEIDLVLKRHGLQMPYLLNVSTWEPGKNQALLVRTFLRLRRDGRLPSYQLALVGKRGWGVRPLERLVAASPDVKALSWVSDADLPALYSGANAFVFPSIYEGLGLPLTEARACGCWTVATDSPEMREAGGPSGIYIEPSESGLAEGILRAVSQPAAPTPSPLPTWEAAAEVLAAALLGTPLPVNALVGPEHRP